MFIQGQIAYKHVNCSISTHNSFILFHNLPPFLFTPVWFSLSVANSCTFTFMCDTDDKQKERKENEHMSFFDNIIFMYMVKTFFVFLSYLSAISYISEVASGMDEEKPHSFTSDLLLSFVMHHKHIHLSKTRTYRLFHGLS